MMKRSTWLTVGILVLLFGGCTAWVANSGGVQWADYLPAVKTELDDMAARYDCAGLQEKFDIADDNNVATMNRTGHNNAELMGYIDDLMRDAGCY